MRLACIALASLTPVALGSGVSFSRTVTEIADDSSFALKFDSGCSSSDDYGSNDCSFNWGDEVTGSVDGELGHDLNDGSVFDVDLKVDRIISWKFSCAACGANCTTTIPVVNQDVNFAMPDCPIAADSISEVIDQVLPTDSPTDGIKVSATGSVDVKDDNGDKVLALDLDITIQ
mmetsp:Transcript_31700/g.54650  ORF Transcript_31700/g.54650 Transcript_31700/m.54650 type:complete len:174 (-) Transcript_31700:159-680(-)|eukprot:CAMPEP_0205923156 /NCGR_PEP_ID=MMETSP1325-20131115/15709_1 /ASSEMBLY_ACC=CAM_ASM_000708 /TAXON_ID=236786 /ORGANISM="Florenciella sp., Strain RCC1007" /LENGTH=173 /DNA_ID=CAMNT_0053291317 /DNA_START=39 /DNA_END=560 /DNA_ORIENTATION=-